MPWCHLDIEFVDDLVVFFTAASNYSLFARARHVAGILHRAAADHGIELHWHQDKTAMILATRGHHSWKI